MEQARPALEAAARLRDILGQDNFFLEMQYQGIEEQKVVNRGILPLARELNLPLVAHQRRALPAAGRLISRTTSCCASAPGKTVNDAQRLRYTGDQFFLKTAEQMAAVFGDHPDALQEHAPHRRALQRHDPEGAEPPAVVRRARRLHARSVLRARRPRRASRSGCRACRQLAAAGRLRHTIDEYERRLEYELEMIKKMGYVGLLPDRLGLHPLRARGGHPGRARPRLGGRRRSSRGACASPTSIRSTSI